MNATSDRLTAMKAELVSLPRFKQDYFTKFRDLFVDRFGFFFAENRMEQFREVLIQYMNKSPVQTFDDYYDYLSQTMPGKIQFQNIMDDITIGETYFFRNEPQLEIFVEHILPDLVKTKRTAGINTIKIWSAGCSSGEEAYTIAILLMENLPTPQLWDIQILGTDINRNVLKKAIAGVYSGERPKRHLKPELLEKYFETMDTSTFRVKPVLQKLVTFQMHNLVKDPLQHPVMIDTDVILCRNVTIYFNSETTRKIVERFYDILRPKGYFLIGHSETLWNLTKKFRTIDFPKAFIYQKPTGGKPAVEPELELTPVTIPELNLAGLADKEEHRTEHVRSVLVLPQKLPTPPDKPEDTAPDALEKIMGLDTRFHQGVMLYEKKDFDSALKIFDEITAEDNQYLIAHFAKATLFSNQAKYAEAMAAILHVIESDNLFLEAYYLKSILHLKLHEQEEAIHTLRKVIYIDPENILAYFHLGNLYQETFQHTQARLAWTNLRRVCARHAKEDLVPMAENLTYETLDIMAEKALNEL